MSTEAQLKAISNTELASGTQIPALKHRTVNNAIIEELYDSQSRGDVLSGVQSAVSLSGGDQVLVIRSGSAFLLDATEFGFVDTLADLTDVNIPTPANDQVLSYNTSTGKWEAKDISALPGSVSLSGVYTLNRLTKITGVNTIGQTIVTDDGTTVNVGGNLSVDNNLTVGTINSGTSSDFVKGDGSLDSTDYQGQIDAEEAARIAGDSNLQSQVTTNASNISTNASNISANTSDIATNTSNISTNTSAISTNQSNITTNASNISTNASNIATNTSDISDNASDIITNANNISTNTSDIATNTSNISTNTSNIATNTSNIATNTSNIATNTGDIATNTSNIATNTSDITDLQNDKQDISEKNQANGYAPLDSGAKIPLANLPDSVLGQVTYEGTWNASTNTPTLANPPASTTKGEYYVSSDDGTQFGIDFKTGDWIISNGSAWEKVDNTDAVTSVFGRLGNVVANAADYASFYPPNSRTISAGTGLSGGGDLSANRTISHADTSSQGSVDNSGLTFIQDVTLDGFGHVTGLGSATVTLPTVNNDTITLSAGTGLSGGGDFNLNQSSAETITFNNTDRGSSQSIFKNVAVGGQSTIVADSNNDTLTFAAGSNVTITTNASTDTITINSSFTDTNNFVNSASFNTGNGVLTLGRSGLSDVTVDLDGRYVQSLTDTLDSVTDRGNTTTNAITVGGATINGNTIINGQVTIEGIDKYIYFDGDQATNNDFNTIFSSRVTSGGSVIWGQQVSNNLVFSTGGSPIENVSGDSTISFRMQGSGGSRILIDGNQVLTDADNVAYTDVNNNFSVGQTINGNTTINGTINASGLIDANSGVDVDVVNGDIGLFADGAGRGALRFYNNTTQEARFIIEGNGDINLDMLLDNTFIVDGNTTINGNVGIGAASPSFTAGNKGIHIADATSPAIRLQDTNNANSDYTIYSPNGVNDLRIYHENTAKDLFKISSSTATFDVNTTINGNLTVDTDTLFVDATNNRVGIGTSSPSAKLDVNGDVIIGEYLSGGDGEILVGQDASSYYLFAGFGADVSKPIRIGDNPTYISIHTANSERMRIDSSGNVSINSGNLSVTGSISATGNVSAYSTSDIRFKDIIGSISSPLERLSRLGGYEFTWNKDIHSATKGQRDIGVVAQEVEAEFPELVRDNPEGIKQVDYAKLTAVLIEAVKELKQEVEELKNGSNN